MKEELEAAKAAMDLATDVFVSLDGAFAAKCQAIRDDADAKVAAANVDLQKCRAEREAAKVAFEAMVLREADVALTPVAFALEELATARVALAAAHDRIAVLEAKVAKLVAEGANVIR